MGQPASFDDSLEGFTRNAPALFEFGVILAICAAAWFGRSALLLGTVFHTVAPDMRETLYRGFLNSTNRSQVLAYIAVGTVLATAVFTVSVVTIPFLRWNPTAAWLALRRKVCSGPTATLGWQSFMVADTCNRRVLMWRGIPQANGAPADLVLGQATFECRDENGGASPCASSMRSPHAIATWGEKLCVTDSGNNRILNWDGVPSCDNAPAATVLGQNGFELVDHNQSLYWTGVATLHMPYGVITAGPWYICVDTANSRLVACHIDDCYRGAAARALTGQLEFYAKGDNGWRAPMRDSLSWPYGISACNGLGVVADSGNNRVLIWPLSRELS